MKNITLSLTDLSPLFPGSPSPSCQRINRVTYFSTSMSEEILLRSNGIQLTLESHSEYADDGKHIKSSIPLISSDSLVFSSINHNIKFAMLLIKSLLLSFAASIHCSSIYAGARIFNIGCANPIHQELDTVQALKPNLKNHLQFGESS